jgi:D-alanyl-D-alanine carboxypeptidase
MGETANRNTHLRVPKWRGAALALACSSLLAAMTSMVSAEDAPASSMVIDANTGTVLHNKAADALRHPASLTKMMTLYMTFELIRLGRLDFQSKIKMTEEAAGVAPSKLELEPGEELSVSDAVKALVTKSANDVAVALAQHIGGSEQNFARLMTQKAHALGMSNTVFKNASGLPDDDQVTTARDMLTLAIHLQDEFPDQYKLFSIRTFTYAGHTYRNHNTMLLNYRGTDGIKTGYTRASGFNLVTSVRRDGKHLVAAVFGGETAGSRNARMRSLLDAAFSKASREVTRKPTSFPRAPTPVAAHAPARAAAKVAVAGPAPRPIPQPVETAAAAPPAPEGDASTTFALAKVRPVLMGTDARKAATVAEGDADVSAAPPAQPLPHFGQALPPSTLQAQADAINGDAGATGAVSPATSSPTATAAPAGPFAIQIGAYSDPNEAEQHMAAARQRAAGRLDRYSAVAVPVRKGSGQLYRARFSGFEADAAASTCTHLRRLQIDCFVVGTE